MTAHPKHNRKLGRHFLRQWRNHRGYTQEQVAERIEMDRGNLSKIERGLVPYDEPLLVLLADIYHCEPQDLIMRNPQDPEAPWSLWEALKPAQKRQAVEIIKLLRGADDKAA